jgi:ribosomal protein L37AE/L43A
MKFCEACNVEFTASNWSTHLKGKKHLKNDLDQTIKPGKVGRPISLVKIAKTIKQCEKCKVGISYKNWSTHIKSKKHLLENEHESDQNEI